jgi:hypothetical protein
VNKDTWLPSFPQSTLCQLVTVLPFKYISRCLLSASSCVFLWGFNWISNTTHHFVGFEVLTVVVMNVAIFWDIAPCSPYFNRCFGGHLLHAGFLLSWFLTLKRGVICSSETSVHIRTTRYIPEDGNIHIKFVIKYTCSIMLYSYTILFSLHYIFWSLFQIIFKPIHIYITTALPNGSMLAENRQ